MRRRRFRRVTIRAFIPNALTMMALCAGMTSIRFALEDRWEAAVLAFVVAAVADGLDGAMARLLKGATRFGAELDSLSDVVSFGVAPALILYQWSLSHPDLGRFGWVIALSLAISCALRLARFNSAMDDEDEPFKRSGFFCGVPAPMAAGLALFPLIVFLASDLEFFGNPILVTVWTLIICFLMVSRIATFSVKKLVVSREYFVPTMLAVALFIASLTVYTWRVLVLFGLTYLASIPFTHMAYLKARSEENNKLPMPPDLPDRPED